MTVLVVGTLGVIGWMKWLQADEDRQVWKARYVQMRNYYESQNPR